MKRFFLLFFLILLPSKLYASDLAIVDIEYIVNNSKKGKSFNSSMQSSRKKLLDSFNQQETKYKEKEKQILSKKKILSEEEFKKEVKQLQNDIIKYRNKKKETLEKFKTERDKKYLKLYKKINEILINYAKSNNIKTVIDKKYVLISKSETDITNQIMKIFDN